MTRERLTVEEIENGLTDLKDWKLASDKLTKRFEFADFAESLDFVNKVAAIAERRDHHPDINFGWGYAEFFITTHDAGGLTRNDFDLAKNIDGITENE